MSLYDTLNLPPNATEEEIKAAYREKAKENHPDVGGDTEKMAEISNAYMVLSNKTKKARYDTTGETKETPFETKLQSFLASNFFKVLDRTKDIIHTDIFIELKFEINEYMTYLYDNIQTAKNDIKRHEEVLNRLKLEETNIIVLGLKERIEISKKNIFINEEEMEFVKKCKIVIAAYGYNFDTIKEQVQPQRTYVQWTNQSGTF